MFRAVLPPLPKPPTPAPGERWIMHVDMDAFFAAVEQQTFPFLRGRPVGVCGDPDGRTVIAAASYEAKRRGVKTAMTLPDARRFCPDIILVPGNPAKYIDTSTRIIACYTRFTDKVEVFSIDEAFLDISHTAHLFGGPEAVAHHIKDWLRHTFGLTCSIGIAPNKLIAKLAGDMHKPDGLTIITAAEVPALLENLPVEELCGIGAKTAARLGRLGIRTCGQLGRFPEAVLVRTFGILGHHLHQMGQGIDPSPVAPYYHEAEAKSMGHTFTLDRDTGNRDIIRRHLLQLSEQVGRRLRQDHYAGRTVSLILRYADFKTTGRQRTLGSWIDDGKLIYRIALQLFDEIYQPPRLIRLLGVSVSGLARGLRQLSIFDNHRTESLFEAVDQINDRYGEFTVARARLRQRIPAPRVISPAWRPDRHTNPPTPSTADHDR